MENKEFNLSERIINRDGELIPYALFHSAILLEDVKEFIRLLKEEVKDNFEVTTHDFNRIIDKLAGEKLTQ